jgi:hypothetical protein
MMDVKYKRIGLLLCLVFCFTLCHTLAFGDEPINVTAWGSVSKDRIEVIGEGAQISKEGERTSAAMVAMIDGVRNLGEVLYEMKKFIKAYESGKYLDDIKNNIKKTGKPETLKEEKVRAQNKYKIYKRYRAAINKYSLRRTSTKKDNQTIESGCYSISGRFYLSTDTMIKDDFKIESDRIDLKLGKGELSVTDFLMESTDFLDYRDSLNKLFKDLGLEVKVEQMADETSRATIMYDRQKKAASSSAVIR